MTAWLLVVPLVLAAAVLLRPRRWTARAALLTTAAFYCAAVGAAWAGGGGPPGKLSRFFQLDEAGLWFLTLLAVVFAASAVYALYYFKVSGATPGQEAFYASAMLPFAAAMAGVILARHLALLWVFVEATTLASAVLIYFERKRSSLEAAWKYVFICSIGIALAFVGIILLSMGSASIGTLYFDDLAQNAAQIDPFWLKMAFAFILIGFGTKMGLAPVHAWLPDAHSEAPSPVSALLSGALLNTAFLGLFRIQRIMDAAGLEAFADALLLGAGFLSLFIAAVFLRRVVNYKRMLAYSSIENMGILAIGAAMGPAGLTAAFLHSAAHSLAKAALFLTSGNILHLYGTKKAAEVHGLLRRDPLTGWAWMLSLLAILGMPPFPAFLSKFLLVTALFQAGKGWLAAPFLLLTAAVLFGVGRMGFGMAFGEANAPRERLAALAYGPPAALLVLMLGIGVNVPARIMALIQAAAGVLP
jgi:hydrogenase-4 component F